LQANTIKSYNSNTDLTLTTQTAGDDVLLNPTSGNVGIGTTNPLTTLHVNGSILANGTINATTDVCIQGGNCLSNLSRTITLLSTIINGNLNVTGNVNITGNLNVTGNITGNNYYAGMWFHNDAGISATLNSTPQIISMNTNSTYRNGFNWFNNSTLELMDDGGLYQIIWKAEGIGQNAHEYHGWAYINGVQQTSTIGHTIGDGNSQVKMLGFGFIELNKYDNVTIRLADMTGTATITAIDGNVNLVRVGN
jgi:hypothetical protein